MVTQDLASNLGSFVKYLKVQIFYTDLQATSGSGAKTITLTGLGGTGASGFQALSVVNSGNVIIPQAGIILFVRSLLVTPFAGGSLSALTVSFGKTSSNTFLQSAQDVFGASAGQMYATAAPNTVNVGGNAAITLNATFTPTGDNCSAATAGEVDLEIVYLNVSTPVASTYNP